MSTRLSKTEIEFNALYRKLDRLYYKMIDDVSAHNYFDSILFPAGIVKDRIAENRKAIGFAERQRQRRKLRF